METAMQIISNDRTVKSITEQGLKEFNSQLLTTRSESGDQLISMMPAIQNAFLLMIV